MKLRNLAIASTLALVAPALASPALAQRPQPRSQGVLQPQPQAQRGWTDPTFAQRFTGTLLDDGRTIEGAVETCRDGSTWDPDLALTYTRVS